MRLALVAILAFVTTAAIAADQAPPDPSTVQRQAACPVRHDAAVYPDRELRFGREGWVILSYVVRTDGLVRDVVIEDSSGVPAFEEAAVKAVSSRAEAVSVRLSAR